MAFDYTNYQELQWISSSGTQYINTGCTSTGGYRYVLTGEFLTDTSTPHYIFGRTQSYHNEYMLANYNQNKVQFSIASKTETFSSIISFDTLYGFDLDARIDLNDPPLLSFDRYGEFNNETISIASSNDITNQNSYLFCRNNNNSAVNFCKFKLYFLRMYDNTDTMVRQFKGAKRRADDVVGLFDTVNEVFYMNSGTGVFTAGPVVTPTSDTSMKLNVNGTWKDCIPYVNVNGTWKEAKAYLNVNGTWKEGIQ